MNIITATRDTHLFAPWFRDTESWRSWFAFLKALFALDMDEQERAVFEACTSRRQPPSEPVSEAWLVVGRRGGKSFVTALIAVYLACFRDYTDHLAPGERGHVMVLATDKKQARVIMRYVSALLENVPMLAAQIVRTGAGSIELGNRIVIEIQAASFRGVRGYTVVAALCDEIAFWRSDESANPDKEILAALRPAMSTIPNSLLIGLSSPYAKRGVLYESYRDHFGQDSNVLVWQADTQTMNPAINPQVIEDAYTRDPTHAAAEYGAQFRSDLETFVPREVLDDAVATGVHELPYNSNYQYVAFTDPSGGSKDSFTLAIAHDEEGTAMLDCVAEHKPPFSPDAVVKDFAQILKRYHINSVTGDRYGGEFPRELFSKNDIRYELAEYNRSELYLELLPALMSGTVQLLENKKLLNQLAQLERRTARSGKDAVDHPPGGHDDLANSVAGALNLAIGSQAMSCKDLIELNAGVPATINASYDAALTEGDPYGYNI